MRILQIIKEDLRTLYQDFPRGFCSTAVTKDIKAYTGKNSFPKTVLMFLSEHVVREKVSEGENSKALCYTSLGFRDKYPLRGHMSYFQCVRKVVEKSENDLERVCSTLLLN